MTGLLFRQMADSPQVPFEVLRCPAITGRSRYGHKKRAPGWRKQPVLAAAPIRPVALDAAPYDPIDVLGARIPHAGTTDEVRAYRPANLSADQPIRANASPAPTSRIGGL